MNQLMPDFDSRTYGFKKLSALVRSKTDLFETTERTAPGQPNLQAAVCEP